LITSGGLEQQTFTLEIIDRLTDFQSQY
jgi:hypothetical protein